MLKGPVEFLKYKKRKPPARGNKLRIMRPVFGEHVVGFCAGRSDVNVFFLRQTEMMGVLSMNNSTADKLLHPQRLF